MDEWTRERADKISEFFGLGANAGLLTPGATSRVRASTSRATATCSSKGTNCIRGASSAWR